MRRDAFSLVEVMVAAAVVAVGLTAAAMLVGTLMQQEEVNAAGFRASNLQEQAAKLFRMDLSSSNLVALLPEPAARTGVGISPPEGSYGFSFSRPALITLSNDQVQIAVYSNNCTMVYRNLSDGDSFTTNVLSIIRPSTRVEYQQE